MLKKVEIRFGRGFYTKLPCGTVTHHAPVHNTLQITVWKLKKYAPVCRFVSSYIRNLCRCKGQLKTRIYKYVIVLQLGQIVIVFRFDFPWSAENYFGILFSIFFPFSIKRLFPEKNIEL